MNSMINKVVWITGASSGIGEALVYACANRGATIILSARREEELIRVVAAAALSSEQCMILPFDISDTSLALEMTKRVMSRFGRVDILFNNAGISSRSIALNTPLEIDRKVMEINYFGVVALTKAVVPWMVQAGTGQVVVTSSVMGKIGTPQRSAYAASKHALHGFFDCLRAELTDTGVGVTVICPGYIRTQISVNAITETGDKFNKMSRFQQNGMNPDKLAVRILRAVRKNKSEPYFGGVEVLGIYLNRFCPALLRPVLRNQQRKSTFKD